MRIKQGQAERMITTMAAVGALLGATAGQAAGQCPLSSRLLRLQGLTTSSIASVVYDDGTGPAIFAGAFQPVGGVSVRRRGLDGVWRATAVAPGATFGPARAFLVDTDPQGTTSLLTGSSRVVRWSGVLQQWESISPPAPRTIETLTRHTDSTGSFLVASGINSSPQGVAWRLNGGVWERMGTRTTMQVQALVSVDEDGAGPGAATLYAVGRSGPSGASVARWDGTEWQGLPGLGNWSNTGIAFDDGGGPRLYVSGHFSGLALTRNTSVARWTGSAWEGVDNRAGSTMQSLGSAYGFGQFDDGSGRGRELYAQTIDGVVRLRDGQFSLVHPIATNPAATAYVQYGLGVGRFAPGGLEVLFIPQVGGVAAITGCNACPADVNYDGIAAVTDVLQFINAWFAGLPEADFNRSGALSVDDVLAFISAWTGGC